MFRLALANLLHRKLRTLLSVAAVAVGVLMLVVLVGLSRGSVDEVRRRFESVDAEVLLTPENFAPFEGEPQIRNAEARAARITADVRRPDGSPVVAAVIPVLVDEITMAGQRQRVFGIHPGQWRPFAGNRQVVEGRALQDVAPIPADAESVPDAARQLVIDDRLARAGRKDPSTGRNLPYRVGERIRWLGAADWTIVGIVETGVAGRVFAPIATLRHYRNTRQGATLLFAKLTDPDRDAESETLLRDHLKSAGYGLEVQLKNAYGKALLEQLRSILLFTDVISAVSVLVGLLVILLTVYTMVVERTHEIAVLRSLGASRAQVLGEILTEAVLIGAAGTAAGVAGAFGAAAGIQAFYPLLTCDIRAEYLVLATAVGVLGAAAAALPPAWSAARTDPAEALSTT